MSFERTGVSALEYKPCTYGASRLSFRGPKRPLDAPYVAFVGGGETYGRCVVEPFPDLVEAQIGRVCVNLGVPNAGVDAYLKDPAVSGLLSEASLTVVQVFGAANLSNRLYQVHPRRNDRFVAASKAMKAIYDDVDFTDFSFTRHMLHVLADQLPDRFQVVRDEVRIAWNARMRSFLEKIDSPVVLLWLRVSTPDRLGDEPVLVTPEMVDGLRDVVRVVVEVSVDLSGPAGDLAGMVIGPTEQPLSRRLIGPNAHAEIADALSKALDMILS